MRRTAATGTTPGTGRRVVTAVGVLTVATLLASTSASADVGDPPVTTTAGTVHHLVVDEHQAQESEPLPLAEILADPGPTTVTYVEVDGMHHEVDDDVLAQVATGEDVVVTLQETAAGTAVEVIGTTSAPAAADEGTFAYSTARNHEILVLPVHFGASDGTSSATLQRMADESAAFWREQSGGRLAMTAARVGGWKRITMPSHCNLGELHATAVKAHGAQAPSSTRHVIVYMPHQDLCGTWSGVASVGGGLIIVNGDPYTDVASHEIGHNLGLGHANTLTCTANGRRVTLASTCTVRFYGDEADVMGISLARAPGSLNTAFADHLGFGVIQNMPLTGTHVRTIHPLRSIGQIRGYRVRSSHGVVHLDHRPATGRDERVRPWAGVQAHLVGTDEIGAPTTYLLDLQPSRPEFASPQLPVGASWTVPGTVMTVTTLAANDTSARLRFEQTGAAEVERYVRNVYGDLFGREPDPQGLATWTHALNTGTPRVAVAQAITGSDEYRLRLIAESYRTYLGRSPDRAGHLDWLDQMRRGMTIQVMESGFLASDEYYNSAGRQDARWVTRLYQHVLGRAPAQAEIGYWVPRVRTDGRRAVALGFLMSTEHLTTVVDGHYRHLLGRSIDPVGRRSWVQAMQGGMRAEEMIGGIIASEEYYRKR